MRRWHRIATRGEELRYVGRRMTEIRGCTSTQSQRVTLIGKGSGNAPTDEVFPARTDVDRRRSTTMPTLMHVEKLMSSSEYRRWRWESRFIESNGMRERFILVTSDKGGSLFPGERGDEWTSGKREESGKRKHRLERGEGRWPEREGQKRIKLGFKILRSWGCALAEGQEPAR